MQSSLNLALRQGAAVHLEGESFSRFKALQDRSHGVKQRATTNAVLSAGVERGLAGRAFPLDHAQAAAEVQSP